MSEKNKKEKEKEKKEEIIEEKEKKEEKEEIIEEKKEEKKQEGKRDDYYKLVKNFQESTQASIDSFQESNPREIKLVSVYSDSRSGIICETDEQGVPHIMVTGKEPAGKDKQQKRQRFFMGIQTEAFTKDKDIKSESLMHRKKSPKPFDVTSQVDQLLKETIPDAQDAGDKIQRKIDEETYEWFDVKLPPVEENTIALDTEEEPELKLIKDLVVFARGELAERLGAKVEDIKVRFIKWSEHYLYADSLGNKTDIVLPRVSFVIQVETKKGSTAFASIRGSCGSMKEVLARYIKNGESKEPRDIIQKLVEQVVKEANDLDRAQDVAIIGATECPVILSPQVAGVLAHEVFGHSAEGDIICENRRNKDARIQLKSRLGAQVSDYPKLTIIDTPEHTLEFPNFEIKHNFGSLPVDGHGNKAKSVTIVENGIMVGALMDRYTFNEIKSGLKRETAENIEKIGISGNVRREKFDNDPLIRMRNTFIAPDDKGPSTKEEMAKKIPRTKKGLYIKSCHGGSVSTDTGDFQLKGNLCYLIENGIVTDKPVKNVRIIGNLTKFVSSIKSVGNAKTMHHTFTGWCGKDGQSVPVDGAGPLLYIESAYLGGGSARPWLKIVEDYIGQRKEVAEGKRGKENINIPEFREFCKETPQHNICLVSAILPGDEEIDIIIGKKDYSTHEMDDNGKLRERRNKYD